MSQQAQHDMLFAQIQGERRDQDQEDVEVCTSGAKHHFKLKCKQTKLLAVEQIIRQRPLAREDHERP
jgi:hypothetical protein